MSRGLPPTVTRDGGGTKQHSPHALETGGSQTLGDARLPYLPGLDGLRALAVTAVLLYHAGLAPFRGGFLGVEVFFVISGYLITTLLLAEWRRRGRIDLKAFWLRRARRLLPALYLLLVATLAFAVVFLPGEVASLRDDALAAFGYVTNWYLILGHKSYFETAGRPSLLQHLWSLAVEEQFYLLWPLLLTVGLWGAGVVSRWRQRLVLVAVLAGAASSALLMAALYRPDVDPSRIYYGTDTRAAGLLIGAALAFVWAPGQVSRARVRARRLERLRRRWGWVVPMLLDIVGVAALAGLVLFCLELDETQSFLFRGGFALVALTTAALIAVVVHPRAHLNVGLLGRRPLRWVGLRSYGIYLWHWPVFMVTRPQLDVPLGDGLPLLALRLTATVVLAALSYHYVETPIRTGALGRAWRRLREARGGRRWRLSLRWAGVTATGAAFVAVLGVAVAYAQPPAPPSYLSVESVHTEASIPTPETGTESPDTSSETTWATDEPAPAAAPSDTPASTTPASATPAPVGRVTAIGDSVMVGAAGELQRAIGNPEIDAAVGRQAAAAIAVLQEDRAAGQLGDTVVIHIGTNGTFSAEQFDEIMKVLKDTPKVVFVNVKVPRTWEEPNNEVLADGVQRYPNTTLVDWHSASINHPEYFAEDGYHLQPEGQRVYADLIAAALEAS